MVRNPGWVLLGLVKSYENTGDENYLTYANRVVSHLKKLQEENIDWDEIQMSEID